MYCEYYQGMCIGDDGANDEVDAADLTTSESAQEEGTSGEEAAGNGDAYCVDEDMDGFGDPNNCETVPMGDSQPPGTVPEDDATDCDDSNASTFPGAAENDSLEACMQDEDMDGFGDDSPSNPNVEIGSDCDDGNSDTFPGSAEIEGPDACMQDEDGDGYGEHMPPEGVEPGSDCNDADTAIFMCVLWCIDADFDGQGDPTMCVGVPEGEQPPNNTVPNNGDCANDNPDIFEGAAENEPELCTADLDNDGWGDDSITDTVPNAENGTDCDDGSATTFPGAAEIDDPAACMSDADEDGWGDDKPPEGVAIGHDCDDDDGDKIVCVDVNPSCTDTNLGMGTQFDATAWGGDGNYTFSWDNADTLDDPMSPNPVATPDEITTYTVTATDSLNNSGSDKVTVHINDAPWVLGGQDAECMAVGFLGAAAPHSFANMGTTTCTTANSDPTAYVCPTVHENAKITGTMVVNPPADDDDYIGFVWGWQNPDQYYLLHWKQAAQNIGGCNSAAGITVKLVDRVQPYAGGDFTCNVDTPNTTVLLTPAETTTVGWQHGVQYGVEILYANDQTEITITDLGNNMVVADFVIMDSTYPSGQFGTYDYSQIRACNGPWNSSCL
ncbi:MAG: hypothetical protein HC927_05535 [Deltaproteobacteria bacterium]|nr:hypothetical protein [Deltaproteobacteria bacterium]